MNVMSELKPSSKTRLSRRAERIFHARNRNVAAPASRYADDKPALDDPAVIVPPLLRGQHSSHVGKERLEVELFIDA